MYKHPDYTNAEFSLFERRLTKDHRIRITVYMLDLNMQFKSNITDRFIDGQVDMVAGADLASRTLQASFFDMDREIGVDSGDGGDAGIYFSDRMLRVLYGVYVPELTNRNEEDKWVDIPVFTGPITSYERNGSVLSLEASSKEILANLVWKSATIPKGTNSITAIQRLLQLAGENYFGNLGTTTARLSSAITLAPVPVPNSKQSGSLEPDIYWYKAKSLATRIGKQLYFDGYGTVQLRNKPKATNTPVYIFSDALAYSGQAGEILTNPQVVYKPEKITNVVRVSGKVPETTSSTQTTTAPSKTVYAPSGHPFHPNYLGRLVNGTLVPAYYPEYIQDDKYVNLSAVSTAANDILTNRLSEAVDVSFETLPVPHLDPWDFCLLNTRQPSIWTKFTLGSFTLPLNSESTMTVGYNRISSFKSVPTRRVG